MVKRLTRVWIGLNQLSGYGFVWSDTSPISYVNWASGEPNNQNGENCVDLNAVSGFWNGKFYLFMQILPFDAIGALSRIKNKYDSIFF